MISVCVQQRSPRVIYSAVKCWEIKEIRKQCIPGSLFPLFNAPGYEATIGA